MSKSAAEVLQAYRRDQILTAAHDVIREQGYERTSVDQIAKRAGVSRSTVYEYFGSKLEILRGCFVAQRDELAEELERRIAAASGLQGRLAAFFEICLSRVDRDREFFRAIAFPLPLDEVAASEGAGSAEVALVFKHFDDAVGRILADGFESGELERPLAQNDRECLGTLIVGAMGARCRQSAPPDAADTAAAFASFALRGLGFREVTG